MKKKLLVLFVFFSISFLLFPSAKQKLDEDCKYLKQYFTQAYVNYDELYERGFDIDDVINNIKKIYKKRIGLKKDFDKNAFSAITSIQLTENMEKLGVLDNHLAFKFDKFDNSFFYQTYSFLTGIFFVKKGNNFVVEKSDVNSIKKGMVYTGDLQFLKKSLFEGVELYRFVFLSEKSNPVIEISLDNNIYSLSAVKSQIIQFDNSQNIIFQETDKSLYIFLRDCYLGIGNEEEFEKTQKEFSRIINKIISTSEDKNVILDLRGNNGGYVEYLNELFIPIFYRKKIDEFPIFRSAWEQVSNGQLELQSTEIEKAVLNYQKNHGISDSSFEIINRERKLLKNENNNFNEFVQIKNEKLKNNLYILIDSNTASAAEYGIAISYLFNKEKIFLIGDKTFGAINTGNWYSYILPNSLLEIKLASVNHSNEILFKENKNWFGDTKGFYPDYWVSQQELPSAISHITNDEQLKEIIVK